MANAMFFLPQNNVPASSTTSSTVKIGSGIDVATDGTISVDVSTAGAMPIAGGTFTGAVTFNNTGTAVTLPSGGSFSLAGTMNVTGTISASGSGSINATSVDWTNISNKPTDLATQDKNNVFTSTQNFAQTLQMNATNTSTGAGSTYGSNRILLQSSLWNGSAGQTYSNYIYTDSSANLLLTGSDGTSIGVSIGSNGLTTLAKGVSISTSFNITNGGSSTFVIDPTSGAITTGTIPWGSVTSVPTSIVYNNQANTFSAKQTISSGGLSVTGGATVDTLTVTAGGTNTISNNTTFNNSAVVTLAKDPVNALEAATKQYVDNVAAGLSYKEPVRVATVGSNLAGTYSSANMTLTLSTAMTTLDGITLSTANGGDRILLKDQTTASQNGIYVYTSSTVLTRASDANSSTDIAFGSAVFVEDGTTNKGAGYVVTGSGTFTLDTTSMTWVQFTGAGEITAGTGLSKSGNTLSLASGVVSATNNVTKINVDTYGRVTSAGYLASSDITGAVGNTLTVGAAQFTTPRISFYGSSTGSPNGAGNATGTKITLYDNGSNPSAIGLDASGDFWFASGFGYKWYSGTTPAVKMTLDSSGNLGGLTKVTATTFAGSLSGGSVSATTGTFSSTISKVSNVTTAGTFGVSTSVANASDMQLTTANATDVVTFTPTANGNFKVYVYFRVATAATAVTITVSHNDGAGAQTHTIASGQTEGVGSYVVSPIFINATTGAPIKVTATAGTANNLYVSASIVGM